MEPRKVTKFRAIPRRPIDGVSGRIPKYVYVDRSYREQRAKEWGNLTQAENETYAMRTPRKKYKPLDMSLPGEESVLYRQFRRIDSLWISVRKWMFRTVAACLFLLIAGGAVLASQGYLQMHRVFRGDNTHIAVAMRQTVPIDLLKGEGDGRVNILLLGKGGLGHDGPDLTDTIMLVSIDPVNHEAKLVSVPRDVWVKTTNHGEMKINAAYADTMYSSQAAGATKGDANDAGIKAIEQQVTKVIGVNINYYAMVDFAGFQQAINTVGGVDVNVPNDLVDPTMAWQNNWNPIIASKGEHHMNGYHALLYARSRETTSDFARTQRQRQIFTALEQKIFSLGTFSNPLKDAKLMSDFGDHAQTDLSIQDAMRLYQIMQQINPKTIQSIGLTEKGHDFLTTGMMAGQSIDHPIAGLYDYSKIREYIRGALPDGYIVKEHASVAIVSSKSGLDRAKEEAKVLKSYGYDVQDISKTSVKVASGVQLVDLNGARKDYTRHYLENRLKVTAKKILPRGVNTTNKPDFVIIVG